MAGEAIAAITLLLLGASGAAKVLDPNPTSGALASAQLPSSPLIVRSLGLLEIVTAGLGLILGGPALVGAAALYAGFTLFTWAALRRRIPVQSCGCFGREDTPPSVAHIVYNALAAVALVWGALSAAVPIPWEATLLEATLYAVFAGAGAYASYLLLARLPVVLALSRAT